MSNSCKITDLIKWKTTSQTARKKQFYIHLCKSYGIENKELSIAKDELQEIKDKALIEPYSSILKGAVDGVCGA